MPALDRRLLRSSRVARRHLLVAVALGLVGAAGIVAQAVLLARVVAQVFLEGARLGDVEAELGGLLLAGAVRGLAAWGAEACGRIGAARVLSELRGRLAARFAGEGAGGVESSGELAAVAVQGVDALEAYFARYLPQVVLSVLVPVAVLAWVVHVDLVAAAILAGTLPLIPFFMVLIGRAAERRARARLGALTRLSGRFLDLVRGLPTLRAFNRAEAEADSLVAAGERYRRETMGTLRIAFLSALVLELLAMLGTAMVAVVVGTRLATGGGIGFEHAFTVLLLAPELYLPLRQLGTHFHAAADGLAATAPIFDVLERPEVLAAPSAAAAPPDARTAAIRFDGVRYAYPARPALVLDGLDLELRPGERVALLAPSGSGKSTLASLLLRLADPLEGRVTVGGRDLRELDAAAWRAQLAWLPQRPHLFAATIADNVRLADPAVPDERVEAALAAASAAFVRELPEGLATRIGEGGLALSAGEGRRIALARALLRDAPVLVLDEPTAHLDATTATDVAETVLRASAGRTTLLITHDAGLAARADRVLALVDGRAVERPALELAA